MVIGVWGGGGCDNVLDEYYTWPMELVAVVNMLHMLAYGHQGVCDNVLDEYLCVGIMALHYSLLQILQFALIAARMRLVTFFGGVVGLSARGRPLWCDASDSNGTPSSTTTNRSGSLNRSLPPASPARDKDRPLLPISLFIALGDSFANQDADTAQIARWTAFFFVGLHPSSEHCSIYMPLKHMSSRRFLPDWHGVRTLGPVSFPMLLTGRRTELVQHIQSLGGPPILLWILPAQDRLLLSDGTCALSDDVLAFPCITYNALNGFYFPLRVVLQPVLVPALPDTAAQEHLQLLLFGLAQLHLPATRNIFFCFKNVFTFWTCCTKLCACHYVVVWNALATVSVAAVCHSFAWFCRLHVWSIWSFSTATVACFTCCLIWILSLLE